MTETETQPRLLPAIKRLKLKKYSTLTSSCCLFIYYLFYFNFIQAGGAECCDVRMMDMNVTEVNYRPCYNGEVMA